MLSIQYKKNWPQRLQLWAPKAGMFRVAPGSGVASGTVLNPPVVRALAIQADALHVGGHSVTAGAKPSYGFAICHQPESGLPGLPQAGVAALPGGNLVITWNSISNVSYRMALLTLHRLTVERQPAHGGCSINKTRAQFTL